MKKNKYTFIVDLTNCTTDNDVYNKFVYAKIDNKRIYGYLKKSNNNKVICKYDKLNGLFITISEDKVTHEILSWGEYQGKRAYEYYDEI